PGEAGALAGIVRDEAGREIRPELEAGLHGAEGTVVVANRLALLRREQSGGAETVKRFQRVSGAQIRTLPAEEQLQQLYRELDVADRAAAFLHVGGGFPGGGDSTLDRLLDLP